VCGDMDKYNSLAYQMSYYKVDLVKLDTLLSAIDDKKEYSLSIDQAAALGF
jgi:hypothetical protein